MDTTNPDVFISYAKEDRPSAERLYADLLKLGAKPWLDVKKLLPGQEWKPAIAQAIRDADFFIALLSGRSVDKKGYVQNELKEALAVLDSVPEGKIFLIPARLEECKPSYSRLSELHWVDLFPEWDAGVRRIALSLEIGRRRFPTQTIKDVGYAAPSREGRRFDFDEDAFKRLQDLRSLIGARSTADVVRQALTVFDWLANERQGGGTIRVVRRVDDEQSEVDLVFPST